MYEIAATRVKRTERIAYITEENKCCILMMLRLSNDVEIFNDIRKIRIYRK